MKKNLKQIKEEREIERATNLVAKKNLFKIYYYNIATTK